MSMRAGLGTIAANQTVVIGDPTPDLPGPGDPSTGVRNEYSTNPGAWDGRSIVLEKQVQVPLNLWLPLRSPGQAPALQAYLQANAASFHQGVLGLRYVHFARFLISPDGSTLWVITAFDGDIRSYLMDFVATMADLFNGVMQFIADPPRLPVERYPIDFWNFIAAHNEGAAGVVSAYPSLTNLEIQRIAGARGNNLVNLKRVAPPTPDLLPMFPTEATS